MSSGNAARPRERDLIARWGAGAWRGWRLRARDGALYTVLFQGRPGGSAGPDFRDAVLMGANGARLCGDIELHLGAGGWRAHGHSADPRYNDLALHIILTAGHSAGAEKTTLASGRQAPLVVLAEQPPATRLNLPAWPCADFACYSASSRAALLAAAGWARFDARVAEFAAALAAPSQPGATLLHGWEAADALLFAALAEGLGYGRDRATLRACGERLAQSAPPDALLSAGIRMGAIERLRLEGLLALLARWRARGPIAALSDRLLAGAAQTGAGGAARALAEALRVNTCGAISPGRARILAFNVALPFLSAHAQAPALAELARSAAAALPGLPSNQITRAMMRQLGLPRLPAGALAQQGLQHLWTRHCRTKSCAGCPCAAGQMSGGT